MRCLSTIITILIFQLLSHAASPTWGQIANQSEQIEFNRDIRPILSDRCFLCHGPDQSSEQLHETDLRLDQRESAIEYGVFDFDDIIASEILARITSDDPDEQMPPADSHKKRLSASEVQTIQRWIAQGAEYQKHWAFIPPQRPPIPAVNDAARVANPIDAFVLHKLVSKQLKPSPSADRSTLIRRVTFDLTGLPPTVAEIDAFLADDDSLDIAYAKVVDRLLASARYGEHMARTWLDAARYADTSGYQYDREREQWVWRDWVIHAFNTNMPFDQFTVEQLAGDMLPTATDQTILATGFNRNHPITIEGGVVDEEYRTEYVIDRVVTTSTVFMGQTFLCARCHDHKYDPISQKNFYQFASFFNNVPERGLNGFDPKQKIVSPLGSERLEVFQRDMELAEARIAELNLPIEEWESTLRNQAPTWNLPTPDSIQSAGGATPKLLDDKSILMTETNPATDDYEITFQVGVGGIRSIRLEAIVDPSLTAGSASRGSNGNFVLTEFVVEHASSESPTEYTASKIVSAQADYEQQGFTIEQAFDGNLGKQGWAVDGNTKPENRTAYFDLAEPIPADSIIRIKMLHRYGLSHQIGRFRLAFSKSLSATSDVQGLLDIEPAKRAAEQQRELNLTLIQKFGNETAKQIANEYLVARQGFDAASNFPATMVMKEMPQPRQAYVLERGEYDKPRTDEPLEPDVPEAIGAFDESMPRNRLGLAQWLVSRDQPLTARVTVNRFWQMLFGVGLVKTSEDFGAQGEFPKHPELLDWLAVEFMDSGWDVKAILRTVVMSNTYRQSSRLTEESLENDPENRMLARGPRTRLEGEAIRDNALAVSGLLNATVGGPSVYPYHPDGLWLEINNRPNYSRAYPHQTDVNQQHRRSMYTFWKRTVPPPSVATFDAPSREYCVVRRSSTNTPLQAFVMLHDPQFVEAARHLAARMINEGGDSPRSRIEYGFKLCTSRSPTEKELSILEKSLSDRLRQYQSDETAVEKLLSVGITKVDAKLDRREVAAFTQVARMLMNLSEFLTKG